MSSSVLLSNCARVVSISDVISDTADPENIKISTVIDKICSCRFPAKAVARERAVKVCLPVIRSEDVRELFDGIQSHELRT